MLYLMLFACINMLILGLLFYELPICVQKSACKRRAKRNISFQIGWQEQKGGERQGNKARIFEEPISRGEDVEDLRMNEGLNE